MLENNSFNTSTNLTIIDKFVNSTTYSISFNSAFQTYFYLKNKTKIDKYVEFNNNSDISNIILESYNKFQQAISDALKFYKLLNHHKYEKLNKCEKFFNILLYTNRFSIPIISIGDDAVKADIFYCGQKFTLKVDFDCPEILFIATFKGNKQNKKTLFIKECDIEDYKSLYSFITEI